MREIKLSLNTHKDMEVIRQLNVLKFWKIGLVVNNIKVGFEAR